MSWTLNYTDDAKRDLKGLDGSVKNQVLKGILKALQNPLSKPDGGYGEPLGNKGGINLTGFLKLKFKKLGIRVIYQLVRTDREMRIIIISARADNEVYIEAKKRIEKYTL
jgi:mRNA interferase RelE/StbE